MGRGNLEAAGTEIHLHVFVHDDGNGTPYQRHNHFLPFQPCVALVVGIDAYGRVAEDGLGTCGGHHDIFVLLTFHLIAEMVKVALLLLVDNLLVGKRSESLGIPVDHTDTTINQPLVVEMAEHADHTF